MFSLTFNKQFFIAAILFTASGVLALFTEEPLWMLVPFAWIFFPLLIERTDYLFYILIALLPLSTEVNITPSLGFDFPDEIIMMLLTGIFLVKVAFKPSSFPRNLKHHPLIQLLALYVVWLIITCCYSSNPLLSVKFILAKTWFFVPFVILPSIFLTDKKSLHLLALLLLAPMAFVVVQSLIRHSFYGFSFEGIKNTLSPYFRNHVNYSAMLVCLLTVAWTAHELVHIKTMKLLLKVGLMIGLLGVALSYSRGAWVALMFGIVGAVIMQKKLMKVALVAIVASLIVSIIWLAYNNNYLRFANEYNTTIFHKDIKEHLQATIQLKDVSNAERFYRWTAAAKMIAERPVIGFGPNTFYNEYKPYAVTPFKTWVSNNPEHSTVHNYFLLTALEQGLPGLIFFCLLYFGMLLESEKLYSQIEDRFYKATALTVGIVLIMIGALIFMSDLIETDKIGSLFWLCLGVLIVLKEKLDKENMLAE
jgi:O-antigen ligase